MLILPPIRGTFYYTGIKVAYELIHDISNFHTKYHLYRSSLTLWKINKHTLTNFRIYNICDVILNRLVWTKKPLIYLLHTCATHTVRACKLLKRLITDIRALSCIVGRWVTRSNASASNSVSSLHRRAAQTIKSLWTDALICYSSILLY